MATIDRSTVRKLTQLARIACSEEEEEGLFRDLENVLCYIEQLDEVHTENIEPMSYVSEALTAAPLRGDVPVNDLDPADYFSLAPEAIARLVRVPSVIKSS